MIFKESFFKGGKLSKPLIKEFKFILNKRVDDYKKNKGLEVEVELNKLKKEKSNFLNDKFSEVNYVSLLEDNKLKYDINNLNEAGLFKTAFNKSESILKNSYSIFDGIVLDTKLERINSNFFFNNNFEDITDQCIELYAQSALADNHYMLVKSILCISNKYLLSGNYYFAYELASDALKAYNRYKLSCTHLLYEIIEPLMRLNFNSELTKNIEKKYIKPLLETKDKSNNQYYLAGLLQNKSRMFISLDKVYQNVDTINLAYSNVKSFIHNKSISFNLDLNFTMEGTTDPFPIYSYESKKLLCLIYYTKNFLNSQANRHELNKNNNLLDKAMEAIQISTLNKIKYLLMIGNTKGEEVLKELSQYDDVIEKYHWLKLQKLELEINLAGTNIKKVVEKYQEFNAIHLSYFKQGISEVKNYVDDNLIKKGLKSVVKIINI